MTAPQRGGPPKEFGGSDVATRAAKPADSHLTAYRRQDGHAAPNAEDRAVAAAIEVLRGHGFGIACRCVDCNHPITSAASLARMRGPRCAARAGVTI